MVRRLELRNQVVAMPSPYLLACVGKETISVVSRSDRFALCKDHQGCLPWKPTPGGQK